MTFAGWRGQGQWLGDGWTPEQRRVTVCQIARALVGKSTRDPEYVAACYPWDDPAVAALMAAKQHKCALTAMAIARAFGFVDQDWGKRYAARFSGPGPMPADAMTQIQHLPAWHKGDAIPQPGEVAIVWLDGTPALTHALTVVEHDGDTIVSVDGHYGAEPVTLSRREVVRIGGQVWLRGGGLTRRVLGVVRCGELVPTREWVLPA